MMEQLKPCRCGNKYPIVEYINGEFKFYYVLCKKCKRRANSGYTREEAIKDWNRRADNESD